MTDPIRGEERLDTLPSPRAFKRFRYKVTHSLEYRSYLTIAFREGSFTEYELMLVLMGAYPGIFDFAQPTEKERIIHEAEVIAEEIYIRRMRHAAGITFGRLMDHRKLTSLREGTCGGNRPSPRTRTSRRRQRKR